MKTPILTFLIYLSSLYLAKAHDTHVLFTTSFGEIEVVLFDDTPAHRKLFLQAIADSTYHEALFNRVIAGFVNQGGELDEPILEEEQRGVRKRQRLPAEILPHHYHQKGALGAGRDDNPEKASYLSQIYFVVGKVYTDRQLDALEQANGVTIPADHRSVYTTIGGIPRLDGDYTIFGQVVRGMSIVEQINQVKTDTSDRPIEPVSFSVRVLDNTN